MSTPVERKEVLAVFMSRIQKDKPELPTRLRKALARRLMRDFFNAKRAGLLTDD